MIKNIKHSIYRLKEDIQLQLYRAYMKQNLGLFSQEYEQYLDAQLQRSFYKKSNPLQLHTRLLVDKLAEFRNFAECHILCIGCRNTAEINYFKSQGANKVIGIDLFSSSPDITIMDMHKMTFPDNNFDIIYSAHSLEHSYDVGKVVREIIRVASPGALVAVEVPVEYKVSSTDLVDFGNLESLYAIFDPYISQVLWSEEQPPLSPQNEQGTAIIRTIFEIDKSK